MRGDEACDLPFSARGRTRLPLPKGEGRGEGEARVPVQPVVKLRGNLRIRTEESPSGELVACLCGHHARDPSRHAGSWLSHTPFERWKLALLWSRLWSSGSKQLQFRLLERRETAAVNRTRS